MMTPDDAVTQAVVPYPINISTATTTTVRAIETGRRFHVMGLFIRAAGAQDVTFQSEANLISGAIPLSATLELNLPVSTVPHMSGLATGEDFKITTTQAVQTSGWALIAEEK
jgi:hypothetical protein